MRKVRHLPTRDCEAGYNPDVGVGIYLLSHKCQKINTNEYSIDFIRILACKVRKIPVVSLL